MASELEIVVDDEKVKKAIENSEGIGGKLRTVTNIVVNNANNLSAGYRTGKYHRDHKSPAVGGTQPVYGGNAQRFPDGYVGIVHPKNYAAMKDNHQHNTILKALGSVGDV